METTPKFKRFLVKIPSLFKLYKRHFYYCRILENKKRHVIIFLLLKLALLSQKMKIQNHTILVHNERFLVPKNQLILCKTVTENTRAIVFLRKTMDPGGALKYF